MAHGFVRETFHSAGNDASASNAHAYTPSTYPTTGLSPNNALILFFSCNGASTTTGVGITDSKGNTWTIIKQNIQNSRLSLIAVTNQDVANLVSPNTITVTINASDLIGAQTCVVQEYNGVATSFSDVSAVQTFTTATSMPTGTTAATAQANEVALAYFQGIVNQAATKDANYSNFTTTNQGVTGGAGNNLNTYATFKILNATGTQSATYTSSPATSGQCMIACIKMTTYTQALSATPGTPSTSKIISPTKILSISSSQASSFLKSPTKILSISGSQVASFLKRPTKILSSTGSASSATKAISLTKILSVTGSGSASYVRFVQKIMSLSAGQAVTFVKDISKILSISVNQSATFTKLPATTLFSNSEISYASIIKLPARTLSVSGTGSANIVKDILKTLFISVSQTTSRNVQYYLSLNTNNQGSVSFVKDLTKIFSLSNQGNASFTRLITKIFPTISSNTSTVLSNLPGKVLIADPGLGSVSITKAIFKTLSIASQGRAFITSSVSNIPRLKGYFRATLKREGYSRSYITSESYSRSQISSEGYSDSEVS